MTSRTTMLEFADFEDLRERTLTSKRTQSDHSSKDRDFIAEFCGEFSWAFIINKIRVSDKVIPKNELTTVRLRTYESFILAYSKYIDDSTLSTDELVTNNELLAMMQKEYNKLKPINAPKVDEMPDDLEIDSNVSTDSEEYTTVTPKEKKPRKAKKVRVLEPTEITTPFLPSVNLEESLSHKDNFPFSLRDMVDPLLVFRPELFRLVHSDGKPAKKGTKPGAGLKWEMYDPSCYYDVRTLTPETLAVFHNSGWLTQDKYEYLLTYTTLNYEQKLHVEYMKNPGGSVDHKNILRDVMPRPVYVDSAYAQSFDGFQDIPIVPADIDTTPCYFDCKLGEIEQLMNQHREISPAKMNFVVKWVDRCVKLNDFKTLDALEKFCKNVKYAAKSGDVTGLNKTFYGFLLAMCSNRKKTESVESYESRTKKSRAYYFDEQADAVWNAYKKTPQGMRATLNFSTTAWLKGKYDALPSNSYAAQAAEKIRKARVKAGKAKTKTGAVKVFFASIGRSIARCVTGEPLQLAGERTTSFWSFVTSKVKTLTSKVTSPLGTFKSKVASWFGFGAPTV